MKGVNKVILVGTLGKDPETKVFDNGNKIVNISMATTESWKDKSSGIRREDTSWHRVVFNSKMADIALKFLKKGSKVYIEGKIKYRTWKDEKGGQRTITEIVADSMQMIGDRFTSEEAVTHEGNENFGNVASSQKSIEFDDDLPF